MMQKDNTHEPSPLVRVMMDYLDCPCRYFPPMEDDGPIIAAWEEARRRGDREGFTPVLVTVRERLWESLRMNACAEKEDLYAFDRSQVKQYRREIPESPLQEGEKWLAQRLEEIKKWMDRDAPNWDAEPTGEPDKGEEKHRFTGYWNYTTRKTEPILLAEIPARVPWEVFAWLPFGGWNECPDTLSLIAVCRHWRKRYMAVPAVVGQDTLEFILPAPVGPEDSIELAKEHCAFCPDIVDLTDAAEDESVLGKVAAGLEKSTVWSFWWD